MSRNGVRDPLLWTKPTNFHHHSLCGLQAEIIGELDAYTHVQICRLCAFAKFFEWMRSTSKAPNWFNG